MQQRVAQPHVPTERTSSVSPVLQSIDSSFDPAVISSLAEIEAAFGGASEGDDVNACVQPDPDDSTSAVAVLTEEPAPEQPIILPQGTIFKSIRLVFCASSHTHTHTLSLSLSFVCSGRTL